MDNLVLILRILKTAIGVFGVLGNGLVIVVFCRVRFMHRLTTAFPCHQLVIDLLGSLMLVLQSNVPVPEPLPDTIAGGALCRVWIGDSLLFLLFVTSSFNLLALTLERYVAIVHPFRFEAISSRKGAAVMMVASWAIGITLKSYPFFIYTVVDGKCISQYLEASQVMGPVTICLQFFVPSAIMPFCHIHIAVVLKRKALPDEVFSDAPSISHNEAVTPLGQLQEQQQRQRLARQLDAFRRARRDILQTLVIVFATYLICWTPGQLVFFMFNMGWLDLDGPLGVTTTVLVALNCCLNPIIYSFKYKQFRRALQKMLGRSDDGQFDGLLPSAVTQMTDHYSMQ